MSQQVADTNGDTVLRSVSPYSMLDLIVVLRDRWILVLGTMIAAIGASVALTLTSTKQYDATADLLLLQTDPVGNLLNPGSTPVVDPARNVDTSAALIKLDTVANTVRDRLGLRVSASDLLSEISVGTGSTSDVVSVTAQDRNPRMAARIANGFATQYVSLRRQSARANLDRAASIARRQLRAMSPAQQGSVEGQDLVARLQELHLAASSQTGGVEVANRATVPSSPSEPRPVLNAVLGLVLGLVAGVLLAMLFEFVDTRPRFAGVERYKRGAGEHPAAFESERR